ncbi:MAG: hypothetical protein ACTH3E_06335 [Psychroflexus halocasei]
MKTMKAYYILFIFTFFILTSCSNTVEFPVSDVIPSSEAKAVVKKDDNENYQIKLEIDNLTEPDRLNPPKKYYIFWAETEHGSQNLGQIKVKEAMLSSKKYAKLETSTPHKPLRLVISAENEVDKASPGTFTVLEANVKY